MDGIPPFTFFAFISGIEWVESAIHTADETQHGLRNQSKQPRKSGGVMTIPPDFLVWG